MLEELKRCNRIGNIRGLLFLISMIKGKALGRKEIIGRCNLERDIDIHPIGAVAFLEYLGLVDTKTRQNFVIPKQKLKDIAANDEKAIIISLVTLSIDKLFEEGIFDNDATSFSEEKSCLAIKKSAFPLSHAVIRNFLIKVSAFSEGDDGYIYINAEQEAYIAKKITKRRKKLSLKKLLKDQEGQRLRGLEAEEFVLRLEKERLPEMADKIKRISDLDVAAGYDIISYESSGTRRADRFIEVKSYIGKPHFYWSRNESETAARLSGKYLICLVDYSRIKESGYRPEYIRDPYKIIFEDMESGWYADPYSYDVRKIL